jgi:hypothetical protein
MARKNNVDEINLQIKNIITHNGGGIRIEWTSDLGFGQYDIQTREGKIIGHSEAMDNQDDKDFLRKLLELLADKTEVVS